MAYIRPDSNCTHLIHSLISNPDFRLKLRPLLLESGLYLVYFTLLSVQFLTQFVFEMQYAPFELFKLKTVFALDFLFRDFYHLFEVRLDNFYVLPLLIYNALRPPFACPESIFQSIYSVFQLFFVDD